MKTLELILLFTTTASSLLHLAYYFYKYGFRQSISAYYYDLKKDNKKYLFKFFIAGIVIPVAAIAIIESIWLLLAVSILISFVGIFPEFKDDIGKSAGIDLSEAVMHGLGAIGGILLAMFLAGFKFNQKKTVIAWVVFMSYAIIKKINYYIYWMEFTAIVAIILALTFRTFDTSF